MTDNRPHLSPTQISMFLRCPRQWAFRYKENLRVPPSGAMKQSGAWHKTVERNYRQKIETTKDLPLDEMTDFFEDTWAQELQREEVIFDKDQTPATLKDQGVEITKEHHKVIAPTITPATVEERIVEHILIKDKKTGEVTFDYDLVGVVDLTDSDGRVRDNKALGKTPNQDDLDKDIQLSTYSLLYRLSRKEAELELCHDVVVKTKVPKALTLRTKRSREGLRLHLNSIGHIARAIKAEAFPMNTSTFWCSKKWCGYWERCVGRGIVTVDLGADKTTDESQAQK